MTRASKVDRIEGIIATGTIMTPEFVRRMSAPLPRYTSYPTAQQFTPRVGEFEYANGLQNLSQATALSLYIHIPFCSELCWYCGCSTKAVKSREPIRTYLDTLKIEMAKVAALLQAPHVTHLHWGGGTPNILAASEIGELAKAVRDLFTISSSAEFAVEIDPRSFSFDQAKAFADAGVNRISVGVQDFDPAVQKAINRVQSFEVTERAVSSIRAAGIQAINIDLVYGLPHQTRQSVERTIAEVIRLEPDRIALFGYAHLPSRAKHQSLIDESALPDTVERFAQSRRAELLLEAAGYVAVGLDHFAKARDPLSSGHVRRNFQGYTTDDADVLLGFGASAISKLPDGYFQNAAPRQDYLRRISDCGLATSRGVLLTEEDRVRAFVIERLMCEHDFSESTVIERFGHAGVHVIEDARDLLRSEREGLIEVTSDGFRLTPKGKPFVRAIAACFDAYLDAAPTREKCEVASN
jgi:oxygen-independent coproporphyrinogen III oxidase